MTHITKQSERDENKAIRECRYANVYRTKVVQNDWTGEDEFIEEIENQCGPSKYISAAKDQCIRCGKTFTY